MWLYRNTTINAVLKKLGVKKLYDWQAQVIQAACQGVDLFLNVPTSGGKSLIFQLLAILETGRAITLVISPLRALQKDQVAQLTECGVKAAWLNSDLSANERRDILNHLSEYCLLYLAPEQLLSRDIQTALKECNVERVAVDEAHVLPQAAPGFRKAYSKIGDFIRKLPNRPQIIACTATATPKERRTIIKSLGMDDPEIYTQPLRRDNLHLSIKRIEAGRDRKAKRLKSERLLFHAVEGALQEWDGKGSVIIYCPTVKRVKAMKRWLKGRDWSVTAYTGKMSQKARLKAQSRFADGSRQIIVATNAFGLGINKSDVRMVIHAGLPLTLGGYVQEIGRAGRDGKAAKCVLFYSNTDFQSNERILKHSGNKKAVRRGISGLHALKELLESPKCLWSSIEKSYGQKSKGACGHCCRCKANAAQK